MKINVGTAEEVGEKESDFQERGGLLKATTEISGICHLQTNNPHSLGFNSEASGASWKIASLQATSSVGIPQIFDDRLSVFPRVSFSIRIMG